MGLNGRDAIQGISGTTPLYTDPVLNEQRNVPAGKAFRAAFSLVTFSWPRKTDLSGTNQNSHRLARRAKSMDGPRKK